jgi:hypothetical protein
MAVAPPPDIAGDESFDVLANKLGAYAFPERTPETKMAAANGYV